MKPLLYLLLLVAVPLKGQETGRQKESGSSSFYVRNDIVMGGYRTYYSWGPEVGDALFFGWREFHIGGIAKMQPGWKHFWGNIDMQWQTGLLVGGRIDRDRHCFYFSAGPGWQNEHFTHPIYYAPYGKTLGTYGENVVSKGVLMHLEWIAKFSGKNSGVGLYGTFFMSNDNPAVGFGLNIAFGSRHTFLSSGI